MEGRDLGAANLSSVDTLDKHARVTLGHSSFRTPLERVRFGRPGTMLFLGQKQSDLPRAEGLLKASLSNRPLEEFRLCRSKHKKTC